MDFELVCLMSPCKNIILGRVYGSILIVLYFAVMGISLVFGSSV
jgi:hypothetical protein